MAEQSVVLVVGSYRSVAAAEADCASLWTLPSTDGSDELAAAVVEKGVGGELYIDNYRCTAAEPVWGAVLLGASVTVLAAPLGITLLATHLTSRAEWSAAAVIVGRLWHRIPRDALRSMGNLLEAGQAGLVMVGIGHDQHDLVGCLTNASDRVVVAKLRAELAADFERVVRTA